MNERIKELASKAGFGDGWFEESPPGYPVLPRQGILTHFTELIVQDCCKVLEQHAAFVKDRDAKEAYLYGASLLENNFGIEHGAVPGLSVTDQEFFAGVGSSESFTTTSAAKKFGVE